MILRTLGRVVAAADILCAVDAEFRRAWLAGIGLFALAGFALYGARNTTDSGA